MSRREEPAAVADRNASPQADRFIATVTGGDTAAVAAALRADPALARSTTDDGATPLHVAVRHGHLDIVKALLDAGADIDAHTTTSGEPRTALHDSYEYGQPDITALLIARGADYDISVAAARGDFARVDELLDATPTIVNDDSTGLTPLGWAAYGQDPQMIPHLLARGAVLGDELCCACATGNTANIRAFLDAGADPDALSTNWRARPLHVTVAMPYSDDSTAAVQLLLDAGADRHLPAGDNTTTPLALALRRRDDCDPTTDRDRIDTYTKIIALLES